MSILRRTVFYDEWQGTVRFWDWAHVLTTLGTMVEPFSPNVRQNAPNSNFPEFDPTDPMSKISELVGANTDKQYEILGGGTIGGPLQPRNNQR